MGLERVLVQHDRDDESTGRGASDFQELARVTEALAIAGARAAVDEDTDRDHHVGGRQGITENLCLAQRHIRILTAGHQARVALEAKIAALPAAGPEIAAQIAKTGTEVEDALASS